MVPKRNLQLFIDITYKDIETERQTEREKRELKSKLLYTKRTIRSRNVEVG